MDSEEEEDATKSEEKPVEEFSKPPAAGIALPITEMTDDWMDDGQALGSMDSEDEEESKEDVAEEKANESKVGQPSDTKAEKSASDPKPVGIALPTAPCYSPACASGDSRSCYAASCTLRDTQDALTKASSINQADEQKADVPAITSVNEVKPAGIALPITEMTDDWMDDDVAMGSMDSEEEEEGPKTDKGHVETKIENEVIQKVETKKSEETKAQGIALPITEMTDDWMDDDMAMGSMDSEEEEEAPEGHVEKIIEDKVIQKYETEKKAPGIALPITEMTDDWMDDGDAFGSIDSEDEDNEKQENKKEDDIVSESKEETVAVKPKPSGIDLPISEMTDDWMDDDVAIGSIDSEDEDLGPTKTKQEGSHQSNLALPQPSYASIASHEVTQAAKEPELPTTDEVVVLKSGKSLPLVVNVEEKTDSEEDLKDSEGFKEVTTRKSKRERKHSKRVSQCDDEPSADKEAKESEVKPGVIDNVVTSQDEKAKMPVGGFSLPISEMTEDWMDDDIAIISDDEESDHDEKAAVQDKIVEMEKKLSMSEEPKAKGFSLPTSEVIDAWMDDDIAAIESEEEEDEKPKEEYDDDDMETQMLLNKKVPKESPKTVKEGRLSALAEAQKFSCDEEDEEAHVEEITIIDEVKVIQDDESTSWAFVAAKESHKKGVTASSETRVETSEHAPALVVEIIEKEKKVETIDKEGYKVVKGKNKVKKTSADMNEKLGTVDLIKELYQPLEPVSPEPKAVETTTKKSTGINLPVVEMTEDWMDDAVVMGSMESDDEEEKRLPKISLPEEHSKPSQKDSSKDSGPDQEEINDPWLAVKPEYKRKDSTSSEKESDSREEGYTIQVKVTTKETCLGRRLHENETTDQEWKMDVTCTQKGQIPNIVEGHEEPVIEKREKRRSKSGFDQIEEERKYHSLPRQKTSSECSPGTVPPLSPSWMRKDLSKSTTSIDSNQSIGSGLIKERKTSDSISSIVTSSCETLDDVYWRLKQKVKKKKRKNRVAQETDKSPERKVPSITEPIIEETSTTSQSALKIVTS